MLFAERKGSVIVRLLIGFLALKAVAVESIGFRSNLRTLCLRRHQPLSSQSQQAPPTSTCTSTTTNNNMQRAFNSLVICGPSGVGKGTIKNALQRRYPQMFGNSVSHTTRSPRVGEVNGVDYYFVSKEAMEAGIRGSRFVEHAEVHGHTYGTSIDSLQRVWGAGRICLLDIDMKGVKQLKEKPMVCAKYVFLMPPSAEELTARLRGRHTESEADIALRLRNAEEEMAYGNSPGAFDVVEVNRDVDSCVDAIVKHLKTWFPERKW